MITSVHNPKVQVIRKLVAQSKARRDEQAFVIEGVRLAEEALQAGWMAKQLLFSDDLDQRGKAVVDGFSTRGVAIEQVSPTVMQAVSDTETTQGLLLVVSQQTLDMPQAPDFMLILDGLRDPGNLGTILRTALAAGVQGVLLAPDCADAWSGKVLRAGMGAHFRLPIQDLSWSEIIRLLKGQPAKLKVYLADSAAGVPYTRADFRTPIALIVGGEAVGASEAALQLAESKVHIPMPGKSESLNAAIAAGILLFEVIRQRKIR
jgi:TrmH family RNA methyltransferase